jgi:hypothetical protein
MAGRGRGRGKLKLNPQKSLRKSNLRSHSNKKVNINKTNKDNVFLALF